MSEPIVAGAVDAADANAQLEVYFNDPTGGFAQNIYLGGDSISSPVEISPGVRLDVSVSAADQPIKDLLRGLSVIAVRDAATFADTDALTESGANAALAADVGITNIQARIGIAEARIDAAASRYEAEETVLTALFNEQTERDQFEAASELQLLESQLEASYLLTARLARLTIADYLR